MSQVQDSILIIGGREEKLQKLLDRLGYQVLIPDGQASIHQILQTHVVDAVVIDARGEPEFLALCEHLRTDEPSKKIPLVCLCESAEQAKDLLARRFERCEVVALPSPLGTITSKIATQLRLVKLEGASGTNVSLAEMNAALRDFTKHFRKELEEARSIQQNLLPRELPKKPGLECAVLYKPLEEVGGDWYTVHETSTGKIVLQVADVTGHGLSAAFICSMTKLALTAARVEEPHALLEEMNRLMAPQLPEGRFVTMASVLLDPVSGELQCASAGHPPALLIRNSKGEVQLLKGKGYALGFFPDATYELTKDIMTVGDVLILFTDGISEAQNRSLKNFGIDRIGASARAVAQQPAQAILNHVMAEFEQFCEGRLLKDDVSLIVIKRTA